VGGVSNLQSYTKRRNNVQREVVERFEFESIYHAQMIFNRYYEWYNNHRKHGYLGRKSPE
jgi:transposase InsO family protein